jgi:hypothetical protein
MEHSILKESTSKNLEVYLKNRVYEQLYYPDFFPIKFVNQLSYETLIGSKGNRVAADIVTYNASAPEKTRKVIDRLTGEIPPIRMKKIMKETDLNDYNILKATGATNMQQLLDLVFGDVDACVDGVNGRLEWLAIQALSRGQVSLSTTNSAGIITQNSIDFQLPSANKEVEAAANNYWTTGAYSTNTPITDIDTIVAEAKVAGSSIKYVVMNHSKWVAFRTSTQVQNYCSAVFVGGSVVKLVPTLQQVNDMLVSQGLPTVIVVDTSVTIETAAHTQTAYDPWLDSSAADRYVLFCPELPLGNMLVGPIAMETNSPKQCAMAKKGHILVSKWSTVDPINEITMGETNAFVSWPTIDQCYILDTESHTTWGV